VPEYLLRRNPAAICVVPRTRPGTRSGSARLENQARALFRRLVHRQVAGSGDRLCAHPFGEAALGGWVEAIVLPPRHRDGNLDLIPGLEGAGAHRVVDGDEVRGRCVALDEGERRSRRQALRVRDSKRERPAADARAAEEEREERPEPPRREVSARGLRRQRPRPQPRRAEGRDRRRQLRRTELQRDPAAERVPCCVREPVQAEARGELRDRRGKRGRVGWPVAPERRGGAEARQVGNDQLAVRGEQVTNRRPYAAIQTEWMQEQERRPLAVTVVGDLRGGWGDMCRHGGESLVHRASRSGTGRPRCGAP
jgi:hypothetical protein